MNVTIKPYGLRFLSGRNILMVKINYEDGSIKIEKYSDVITMIKNGEIVPTNSTEFVIMMGETIWLEIDKLIEVGRPVNAADLPLHAGQMIIYDKANTSTPVTVVKATDTDNLAKVNGLVFNDVFAGNITENVNTTCAVVTSGKIRYKLVEGGIPEAAQAVLPNIEFVPF